MLSRSHLQITREGYEQWPSPVVSANHKLKFLIFFLRDVLNEYFFFYEDNVSFGFAGGYIICADLKTQKSIKRTSGFGT